MMFSFYTKGMFFYLKCKILKNLPRFIHDRLFIEILIIVLFGKLYL